MLTVNAIENSDIYGHGKRVVIWFSGCSLRCAGCVNKYLWDRNSGTETSVVDLYEQICSYKDITGVTFLGGEPLEQGKELLDLVIRLRRNNYDIVLFTGYEFEELIEWQKQVVALSAVIVFGRFDINQRDTGLFLRGSRNQTIRINDNGITSFYANEYRQVEIDISADEIKYLGFPEDFLD